MVASAYVHIYYICLYSATRFPGHQRVSSCLLSLFQIIKKEEKKTNKPEYGTRDRRFLHIKREKPPKIGSKDVN